MIRICCEYVPFPGRMPGTVVDSGRGVRAGNVHTERPDRRGHSMNEPQEKPDADRSETAQSEGSEDRPADIRAPVDDTSNPVETRRKKWKPGCWWIALIPILLLAIFLLQLFGPNPDTVISPETTRITAPRWPDGRLNYAEFLYTRARVGVTSENNAAVLAWQALWPGELRPEHYQPMCEALGMEIPSGAESLVDVDDQSVIDQVSSVLPPEPNQEQGHPTAQDIIEMARNTAWTSDQLPVLAEWAKLNRVPLDLLVQAANRPRYYSPSPTYLTEEDDEMAYMLLPGVQALRNAVRSLATRAMWHVGEERPMDAWRDLHAVHLIARHTCRGAFLIEQLVGASIESIACTGTQTLLHHGKLSAKQARQILADLSALPNLPPVTKALDEGERFGFLDSTMRLAAGKEWSQLPSSPVASLILSMSIDWNVVIRKGNAWYDRVVEATNQPRSQRLVKMNSINRDWTDLRQDAGAAILKPARIFGGIVSRNNRSEWIADVLTGLLLPSLNSPGNAADRAVTRLELTCVAAALAVYRSANDAYPETLAALVPVCLDSMPIDLYSGKPFLYERRGDGYLLYSVFENEADDNGTDGSCGIVDGEWVTSSDPSSDPDMSDLVVRLPRVGILIPGAPVKKK